MTTLTAIFDANGIPLTDGDSVFDFQEGKNAIFHQPSDTDCWLEWEDGIETWLLSPSVLVKNETSLL